MLKLMHEPTHKGKFFSTDTAKRFRFEFDARPTHIDPDPVNLKHKGTFFDIGTKHAHAVDNLN